MSLRKKFKNAYDTGRNGTLEDFRAVNQHALTQIRDHGYYDAEYKSSDNQKELRKGAIDAFFAGQPEKVALIIQYPDEFRIRDGYVDLDSRWPERARHNVIGEIIGRSSDLIADFRLLVTALPSEDKKTKREVLHNAMSQLSSQDGRLEDIRALARLNVELCPGTGKVGIVQKILAGALDAIAPLSKNDPAAHTLAALADDYEKNETRPVQDILTSVFYDVAERPAPQTTVWDAVTMAIQAGIHEASVIEESLSRALFNMISHKKPEASIRALLEAHAAPNAALYNDGYKGRILAEAVRQGASLTVIDLLHANGANFADALHLMKTNPDEEWTLAEMTGLREHAKRITGEPIPGDSEQGDVDQLRAELERTKKELTEKTEKLTATTEKLTETTKKLTNVTEENRRLKSRLRYAL